MTKRSIEPYGIVTRSRYWFEQPERLLPEDIEIEAEARLRHRTKSRSEARYAKDYLVVVVGRTAAKDLTSLRLAPINLDTGGIMPASAEVLVNNEGMVVHPRRWPLRGLLRQAGYFLSGHTDLGESLRKLAEEHPQATGDMEDSIFEMIAPAG